MRIVEAVLPYPSIDPYIIHFTSSFGIRWYAISYITGLMIAWWVILRMLRETQLWASPTFKNKPPATADEIGDFVVWAMLGVVIGGRLGWILLYGTFYCGIWGEGQDWCRGLPLEFVTTPRALEIWSGGMSFHGGLAGVAIAVFAFCRARKLELFKIADLAVSVGPIGLFFGRIANFINGELPGKVTNVPWGMVFCNDYIRAANRGICPAGMEPRHPSQLYEATLEGIILFLVMQISFRRFRLHDRPGLPTAVFFAGYGIARFIAEFFRDSESKLLGWFSMGMALSIPLWMSAAYFFWASLKKRPWPANA
jgi:phosphatidylglycerol---prolipoprotein diacylglyceryl transferase